MNRTSKSLLALVFAAALAFMGAAPASAVSSHVGFTPLGGIGCCRGLH